MINISSIFTIFIFISSFSLFCHVVAANKSVNNNNEEKLVDIGFGSKEGIDVSNSDYDRDILKDEESEIFSDEDVSKIISEAEYKTVNNIHSSINNLSVTPGYPYLESIFTVDSSTAFSPMYISTQIAVWLRTTQSDDGFGSIKGNEVDLLDQHQVPNLNASEINKTSYFVRITMSVKYGNGHIYRVLDALPSAINPLLGVGYLVRNMTLFENALNHGNTANVTTDDGEGTSFLPTIDPIVFYKSEQRRIYIVFSFAPRVNKKIVILLSAKDAAAAGGGNNNNSLSFSSVNLTQSWPSRRVFFFASSPSVANYTVSAVISSAHSTDNLARYYSGAIKPGADVPVPFPAIKVLPSVTLLFSEPPSTVLNFANAFTELYNFTVPGSYRDEKLKAEVHLSISPVGMSCSPSTLRLTGRGQVESFRCKGPPGKFTITYSLPPPTGPSDLNRRDNGNFHLTQASSEITILPSQTVTVAALPTVFLHSPVASEAYGGAFTPPITVTIQRPPKKALSVKISAPEAHFTPNPVVFYSNSTNVSATFIARALRVGRPKVSFTLHGESAVDYVTPGTQSWEVSPPNTQCGGHSGSRSACTSVPGCLWNQLSATCTGGLLPIVLNGGNPLPAMYNREPSAVINVTLSDAVTVGLDITFYAPSRLTFLPDVLRLSPGQTEAAVVITGTLEPRDRRSVNQSFTVLLAGPDANKYAQGQLKAEIRLRTRCTVHPPLSPFYVTTESLPFKIKCELPPEEEVRFSAVPDRNFKLISLPPNRPTPPSALSNVTIVLNSSQDEASFYLRSTGLSGEFKLLFNISGVNGKRFAPVSSTNIRILRKGALVPAPNFHILADIPSPYYNVDLSVLPPSGEQMVARMAIYDEVTNARADSLFEITPPQFLVFNGTQRQNVTIVGHVPGRYVLTYTLTGRDYRDYETPCANTSFSILDPRDGTAEVARLKLGFQPRTACRVNVGRSSRNFRGQERIDIVDQFCRTVPFLRLNESNGTLECPRQSTEVKCRLFLEMTGTICFWYKNNCTYFKKMQGWVRDLAYGSGFVLFVTYNDTVWSVGKQAYGQLGHGRKGLAQVNFSVVNEYEQSKRYDYNNEPIVSVVAGTAHAMALTSTGRVFAWGSNHVGQLGISSNALRSDRIYEVKFPVYENITCISAGVEHSAALTKAGLVYTWGSNEYGQTGVRQTFRTQQRGYVALPRDAFGGRGATGIQCGEYHTMVFIEGRDIQGNFREEAYTFGFNNQGQLGRPGWDEWKPSPTVLYNPVIPKFIDKPRYRGFISGKDKCPIIPSPYFQITYPPVSIPV